MMARRQMWSKYVRWLGLAPLFAALMLTACGLPGSTQTPTAATVLADAQAASIQDLTFTATGAFSFNLGALAGAGGSSATNMTLNADVTGQITTTPQRADLTLTAGGQSVQVNVVTDGATQQGYISSPLIGQLLGSLGGSSTSSCVALPTGSLSSVLDTSIFTNFEHITQAKNIGSDTVNGTAVWHLQGNQTYGGATVTEDFYVAQANSYPVRVVITASATAPSGVGGTSGGSSPSGNATITIDVTKVNSGISISLPTNCQSFGG